MGARDERTLQLEKEYVNLRKQGLQPREIARHFNVCDTTMYKAVRRIAEATGLTTDFLLAKPNAEHHQYARAIELAKPVDVAGLREQCQTIAAQMEQAIAKVKATVVEQEKVAQIIQIGEENV